MVLGDVGIRLVTGSRDIITPAMPQCYRMVKYGYGLIASPSNLK